MAQTYDVTGMTCAACQAHVEKAVGKVPGVKSVSVSLLTNSMRVEGTASETAIEKAVADAGYGAKLRDFQEKSAGVSASAKLQAEEEALEDHTTPRMIRRLVSSVAVLLVLMYFSIGAHMWGWPVPPFMQGNPVANGLLQMLLTIVIMIINRKFFISGFKSLFHGAPNMDALVAIGSGTAFGYSTVMLFYMSWVQVRQGSQAAMAVMNEFYFESAAMILTLITVGKTLESYSKGRTTDALKSLMKLAPKTANVIRDGKEVTVGIDEVAEGDVFVVRPGENIPVDGVVLEGNSAVNEAALTGESIPADKEPGSAVSSATLNQSGFLKCRATRVGEDTTLSQIISMVSDAAATKAPVAKLADTISGYFVPAVIGIAAAVIVIWLFVSGGNVGLSLQRGISVLVVSCPCALGLATPVAIMVGNGVGAKNGILFKTAESLQETGTMQIVALDKTGTITSGTPRVTDLLPSDGVTEQELVESAAALEQKSEHPLAKAVMDYAQEHRTAVREVTDFSALPGSGLTAVLDGARLYGGNRRFITGQVKLPASAQKQAEELSGQGKTPLFFARDGKLLGIIAVADTIKEDSAEAIRQMKNMGIHVVMLTGDNQRTAEAIGRQAGVDEVVAGVLPDGKEEVIRRLQKKGKTAMIGDGINDAPALTRANIGIAIGAGTDVAIDAADVVLMKSRLTDAAAAIRLSRQTYRDIVENLFWALIYNVLLIPLAAGLYSRWGLGMTPMWGAAAMSCSSVFVCLNALRLNLFDIYSTKHDRKLRRPAQTDGRGRVLEAAAPAETPSAEPAAAETASAKAASAAEPVEQPSGQPAVYGGAQAAGPACSAPLIRETIKIEGMMCQHCEARIEKAVGALDGVLEVKADHSAAEAKAVLSRNVDPALIEKAVTDAGYTYRGIVREADGSAASEESGTENLKEEKTMKETVKVNGMMCENCEKHVKKALEALPQVNSAEVSRVSGTAVLDLNAEVSEEAVKKAVADAGYEFAGIGQ
ncbi:MAG: heavy metal translocating P-type ATPase [Lachnospiraceae bacterium]